MRRMAIRHPKCFPHGPCGPCGVCGVSRGFPRLSPGGGQVPYVLLTRAPVAGGVLPRPAAPRLACVRPVASVHPEPGSNSPLLLYLLFFFFSLFGRPPPRWRRCRAARRPSRADARGFPILWFAFCVTCPESTRTLAEVTLLGRPRKGGTLVFVISSVASFQRSVPRLRGGPAKVTTFPDSAKTFLPPWPPGTAVPRLRLQRYYQKSLRTKFFDNFFQKIFTPFHQHPVPQPSSPHTFSHPKYAP